MTDEPQKRFLVIVQLKDSNPRRLQKIVPLLQAALARIASAPVESAFRSLGADSFGYFFKTVLRPGQILERITAPGGRKPYEGGQPPILDGGDGVFVLELGTVWNATDEFSRARTWLQRH
jgi:hypothetical protein